jgi:hypothetical protein
MVLNHCGVFLVPNLGLFPVPVNSTEDFLSQKSPGKTFKFAAIYRHNRKTLGAMLTLLQAMEFAGIRANRESPSGDTKTVCGVLLLGGA